MIKKYIIFFILLCSIVGFFINKNPSESISSLDNVISGKALFRKGQGLSGEKLTGYWIAGKDKNPAQGEQLACISCHSHNGSGYSEAGRLAANITAKELFSDKVDEDGEKIRKKYTYKSLIRLLETGINPNGDVISNTMPRFDLTKSQKKDLFSYLKELGNFREAGETNSEIKILFVSKSKDESFSLIKEVLSSKFSLVFGKKITVEFSSSLTRDDIMKNYFMAIVDDFELDEGLIELSSLLDFPLFLTKDHAQTEENSTNHYLFPSLEQQGKIAGRFVSLNKTAKVGVILDGSDQSAMFLNGFKDSFYEEVKNLKENKDQLDYVLVLSSNKEDISLAQNKQKKAKFIYPSTMRVPFVNNSLYIYPNLLKLDYRDIPNELRKYEKLNYVSFLNLIKIYTYAQISGEVIKKIGTDVSRPAFLRELKRLKFNNKLLPEIQFNDNNFGISGAYLIDLSSKKASTWIVP